VTPGKFGNLQRAAAVMQVPASCCLGAGFFAAALRDHAALDAALEVVLREIQGTSGAFLGEDHARLERLVAAADWAEDADDLLAASLADLFDLRALPPLAVRSAALGEDTRERSFAGLYQSSLDVRGLAALKAAILDVWRSYFSYAAVVERLLAGTLAAPARMNVMVQRFIRPRKAGVAFSRDPLLERQGVIVELIDGSGDALVSGARAGRTVLEGELPAAPAGEDAMLRELCDKVRALSTLFGHEVDVEWAYDGEQLWLLQVRPITTLGTDSSPRPSFAMVDLYEAEEAKLAQLRPLPEFAEYFRKKRGPLHRIARRAGADTGAAWLVCFNSAGLAEADNAARLVGLLGSPEVIVDAGDTYRQRILPRARLLAELEGLSRSSPRLCKIVVRDFHRGERGLISRPAAGGRVTCEISDDGLMALNRGTARARTLTLEGTRDGAADGLTPRQARTIVTGTGAAVVHLGQCQVEWVLAGERAFMVDYSSLQDELVVAGGGAIAVISRGYARGLALRLEEDDFLRRLSEGPAVSLTGIPEVAGLDRYFKDLISHFARLPAPPVLLASRPYAALAGLLPYVGGMLFEHGSLLCHLSIMLRERGIPAVAAADVRELKTGALVTIDTSIPALRVDAPDPAHPGD
jgi:hypothetical protein